jgi:hypothetical protein
VVHIGQGRDGFTRQSHGGSGKTNSDKGDRSPDRVRGEMESGGDPVSARAFPQALSAGPTRTREEPKVSPFVTALSCRTHACAGGTNASHRREVTAKGTTLSPLPQPGDVRPEIYPATGFGIGGGDKEGQVR